MHLCTRVSAHTLNSQPGQLLQGEATAICAPPLVSVLSNPTAAVTMRPYPFLPGWPQRSLSFLYPLPQPLPPIL